MAPTALDRGMSRRVVRVILLGLAMTASAASSPKFKVPAGWQRSQEEQETLLSDGVRIITARPATAAQAAKLAPELYGGKPLYPASVTTTSMIPVAGKPSKRLSRNYEMERGGPEGQSTAFVYEEVVVVPGKKGALWVLDFQSPAGAPQDEPRGLKDWNAFLKSFKPN